MISSPPPQPSPSGRGSTVDRYGLQELFGVCDRRQVEEAKAGSPLRSAPALHRVELNRSGVRQLQYCRTTSVRLPSSCNAFETGSFVGRRGRVGVEFADEFTIFGGVANDVA